MNDKNDSLLEIAINCLKRKKKPQTLDTIQKEVFQRKGLSLDDTQMLAQFEVDFMLCGSFIFCGEDIHGNQLWNLKEREQSSLLDKDGGIIDDIYADDEDVIKNELKDDTLFDGKNMDGYVSDDDIDEKVEDEDDIEEELGLVNDDDESSEVSSEQFKRDNEIDDEDEYEDEDEEDDIEIELSKHIK